MRITIVVGGLLVWFERADVTNRAFDRLEEQWRKQVTQFGEDFDVFAAPYIDHARGIANENPPHKTYGVFLLVDGEDRESVCLSHCNVAELPRTSGKTLRVNWVLLAPKYDYDDTSPESVADIATAFVRESIRLSRGELIPEFRSDHIKMRLNGLADRVFFEGVASSLRTAACGLHDIGFRGNWLSMSNRIWGR